MAVDIAQLAGGAFGGAVASSVLAPIIGQRRERRDLRATVLRWIGELERKRWADASLDEFREAVVAVRAAALIAAAQRDVIDHYVFLAQVARQASDAGMEQSGDPAAAGIPTALFNLVAEAASLVVDHLWHPYRKRVAVARGLRKNRAAERALRDDEEMAVGWSPPLIYG
jgi:hypothetical protein